MTLRDYITRRARLVMATGIGSWLLFAIGLALSNGQLSIVAIIGFAGFFGAIIGMLFFVKCPRCKFNLAQLAPHIASGRFFFAKRQVNFCPCCGVSLDEQLT
jgi:hypothetical protein